MFDVGAPEKELAMKRISCREFVVAIGAGAVLRAPAFALKSQGPIAAITSKPTGRE
jgi:hypothetical protein